MIEYSRRRWYFPDRFEPCLTKSQVMAINHVLADAFKRKRSDIAPFEFTLDAESDSRYMAQMAMGTRIRFDVDFSKNPAVMSNLTIQLHSGHKDKSREWIEKHVGYTHEWLIKQIEALGFLVYEEVIKN